MSLSERKFKWNGLTIGEKRILYMLCIIYEELYTAVECSRRLAVSFAQTKVSKEIEIMFVDTFSSQLTSCSNTTVLLAV